MKKANALFLMAVILSLLGVVEVVSGFVLWFALPHGGGRWSTTQVFWGLTRDTWLGVHNWVGVALMVLVLAHLLAHWKWIIRMLKAFSPHFGRSS